ncbi:hypothetical protein KBY96_12595 [Cyanobium sp. ATX 6A2]|uniref:hypothetical protein n=1 Tax=Cyanobium sp. ATX 6A2 TaxID=2823700 RepID=UPI0020CCB267|nr:hypothetical protein [Cyanobium sp. ATX 6A2]MCP9888762.1 hypothetical protein [Cyanobium sp. ATX 6A2]
MANEVRLLGRKPENDFDIPYRKTYFGSDRNDRFVMRRQSDFYTSVFAYGGQGKNSLELPFSTSDISYSSITRGGTFSIQFRTAIGENQSPPQTVQAIGVRRVDLLDGTLRIGRIFRDEFGSSLPKLPAQARTRWISNGRWDEFDQKQGALDTLTGKSRGANNFYLSGANFDAIIEGSKSGKAVDTLFFDEYESEIDVFLRKAGNANLRVRFVDVDDSEQTRVALFKARNLERLVLRDTYFERGRNRWRRRDGQPIDEFGLAEPTPLEEQPNFVRPPGSSVFNPIPDDIFNPEFDRPPTTEPLLA